MKTMHTRTTIKTWTKALTGLFLIYSAALEPQLQADPPRLGDAKMKVPNKIPLRAYAFDLREVRLLEGPFKRAMELDRAYLLSFDTDRLLHTFRVNVGLPSAARPLGGWAEPNSEVRGHFEGHFLSACALMYASTGDERLKAKGNQMVAGLAECQQKAGYGYLSAYPESFIDRVEKQQQVWAPYYTLHKIFAGLLDMYVYADNAQALEVARKFGDWAIARNDKLTDAQMQNMLGNEHGGMNECLANLYALTGQEKYLKVAQRFNHMAVIGPASKREDKLTHLHANTQIPKFVGTARQFELTGQPWLQTASTFFWNTVVKERSYVIGGHSDGEAFSPKETLSEAFGPSTTETCNTYNMLKLTRHLFCWDPRAEYADYYERALLNHILCSQNPETGMMCYYVPLRSGSNKSYNGPMDSFWCCTGTGVENHAKYGDSIYFHDGGSNLYWNLFIASELNWKTQGLKVRQETRFPDQGVSRLILACEKPVAFSLNVRRPEWATAGFMLRINEETITLPSQPGHFVTITREWKTGDAVEVVTPFYPHTEAFRDNPHRMAFLNGPLVLSAEVKPAKTFPAVVAEEGQILEGLKPLSGKPSTFATDPAIFRVPGQAGSAPTLEPFYKMHGQRHYMVYFDQFTPDQWQTRQNEYEAQLAARRELEARTVDSVSPGAEQNERDHQWTGEKTGTGDFGDHKYRHATEGGNFSWVVKVLPGKAQELRVTYWGDDGGNRVFDILVDGVKLATQKLEQNKPGGFYDETYRLSETMTQGKEKITLKFQAHPGAFAGGVFGVRILR